MGMHHYLYGGMRKEAAIKISPKVTNFFSNIWKHKWDWPTHWYTKKLRNDAGFDIPHLTSQITARTAQQAATQKSIDAVKKQLENYDKYVKACAANNRPANPAILKQQAKLQKQLQTLEKDATKHTNYINDMQNRVSMHQKADKVKKVTERATKGAAITAGTGAAGYGAYKGGKALLGKGDGEGGQPKATEEAGLLGKYGLPVGATALAGGTLGAVIDSENRLRGGLIGGIGGAAAGLGMTWLNDYMKNTNVNA